MTLRAPLERSIRSGLGVLVVTLGAAYALYVQMSHSSFPAGLSAPGKAGAESPPATRVVSLSPSTTETLFAIGAGPLTVGRSRYCDSPPEALALPQVGGYVDPSFEAILGLRPTLVVGARGPAGASITERLNAQGIATYFPEVESFAAIRSMILGVGEYTDRIANARALIQRINEHVNAVEARVSRLPKPRVLLVFGLDPVVVAGPGGFPDEMIRRAGGVNVVTEGPNYPTLGIERVLALEPDIVLNAAMAEAHGAERIREDAPGWRELRAVKTGHVEAITDEEVLRPGPNIAEGLATIARALHPDGQMDAGTFVDSGDAAMSSDAAHP